MPEHSTSVSMDAEDVVLERSEDGFKVTATFTMRNQSDKQVDSTIAFPLLGSPKVYNDLEKEFKVELRSGVDNGSSFTAVKTQWKDGPKRKTRDDYFVAETPKKLAEFPASLVWDMSWKAGETIQVKVSFDMGEAMVLPNSNQLAGGWQTTYIVSTGALWKGPIGRADITFSFGDKQRPAPYHLGDVFQYSYPEQAKWNGKDTISWHFEKWTPSDEIWFRSATWNGLKPEDINGYFFPLQADYQGDKLAYSLERIDFLVERELRLAHEYFPEKVKSFDALALRIAVSDWLLHEIYARHGDSFFVGKETPANGVRDGFVGSNGNLYSFWWVKFVNYSYHGGWYKPDKDIVKTASLSSLEQSNVKFLSKYLTQLREQLGPEKQRLSYPVHVPGS